MIARRRPFLPHKMRNLPSTARLRKKYTKWKHTTVCKIRPLYFLKKNKKTPQNSPWAYPQTFCQKNEFDEFIQDALSTTACPFQPPRERATLYLLRTRLDVTGSRGPTLARARVTSARFFPDSNAPGSRKTQAPPPDWGQQQKSMEIILFPDVCKIFQSEF